MIDFSSTWYYYQERCTCTSAAGSGYVLLWTHGSGPEQDERVSKCTNCMTLAKSVPGSMHCILKGSATSSYLQNMKCDKLFNICFNFFSTFVLNAGQPQDFMHFFSSNTRPANTILSPYFITTANQSRGTRVSLSKT